jgi:outer membrane immunogenic protein
MELVEVDMKRALSLGIAALALAAVSFPAAAADLGARPIGKAPVMAPVALYNWSGFYVGGHIGGLWGDKDWTDLTGVPTADGGHDVSGFLAGGQIGFNWQTGNWVFGVEADASWTNAEGDHLSGPAAVLTCFPGAVVPGGTTCRTEMNWLGTVTGRVGYAFNNVLVYAKGGFAFANEDYLMFDTATGGGLLFASTGDETRTGWTVGAGIEYGFTPNWSLKLEYNYMDFGGETVNLVDPVIGTFTKDIDQQIHVVKGGFNYRFNWGAPVVARY